jgi:hypothetical protein
VSGLPLSPADREAEELRLARVEQLSSAEDAEREIAASAARHALIEEYAGWCARNNLPVISADDHDPDLLTEDQNAWIADFQHRWEVGRR